MTKLYHATFFIIALATMTALPVLAADPVTYELAIKDHRFQPSALTIPANTPAVLLVKNLDTTPAEFESHALKLEKIITGNGEGRFKLRPLSVGQYEFFDEFNPTTARGILTVQ